MSLQWCEKCGRQYALDGNRYCHECGKAEREAVRKTEATKRKEMGESGYLERAPSSKKNETVYPLDIGYDGLSGEDELANAIERGVDADEIGDDDD